MMYIVYVNNFSMSSISFRDNTGEFRIILKLRYLYNSFLATLIKVYWIKNFLALNDAVFLNNSFANSIFKK